MKRCQVGGTLIVKLYQQVRVIESAIPSVFSGGWFKSNSGSWLCFKTRLAISDSLAKVPLLLLGPSKDFRMQIQHYYSIQSFTVANTSKSLRASDPQEVLGRQAARLEIQKNSKLY
jgi:hypothetical protein